MRTNEELVIEYQNGNKEVLKDLYVNNAGLIEKIVRGYQGAAEDPDDLRQESFFGIVRAAELWKPDKGSSFITYAVFWIRQAIQSYLINCGGVVRIPANRRAQIGRYKKVIHAYQLQFGRDPSERELCAVLGLRREQLEELQKDVRALRIRSTSEVIGGEDDDLTLEDTIAADGDAIGDVVEKIQHEELAAALWSCVDDLEDDRAGQILRGRYEEGLTFRECGERFGITAEGARQIEAKALRQLRKPKVTKRIRPFLTEDGARSWSLSGTGYRSFLRYGSVQERTLMKIEELANMSLYNGTEFPVGNE